MNISYPQKWKDVFIFIYSVLLGFDNTISKRISLQKFYLPYIHDFIAIDLRVF